MHNPRHLQILNDFGRWLRHPRTHREARYANDIPDDVELTSAQRESLHGRRSRRTIPDYRDDKPLSFLR